MKRALIAIAFLVASCASGPVRYDSIPSNICEQLIGQLRIWHCGLFLQGQTEQFIKPDATGAAYPRALGGFGGVVMGLDVSVGFIADLRANDPEGAEDFQEYFAFAGLVLKEAGLPEHTEPLECDSWAAQMFGYSGLHYLRRVAAHLDAGLPLPSPGDDKSADDPVLAAYFDDLIGKKPGLARRLFQRTPRFARSFDHLIFHSDAEGFYMPQDFPQVLFADDKRLPGGALGSTPRLLAELERLATSLGIPAHLDAQSEELWEAADSQGDGDTIWEKYGIESYSCVVLREACHKSLATGSAIVFS